MEVKAVLFDLDGVIADTAKFHYYAWNIIANELEIEFNEEINEHLKGVNRKGSLEYILNVANKKISDEYFNDLMERKNICFVQLLDTLTSKDILPGIKQFICDLRANNIKVSIASASSNAPYILEKLGLMSYVDYIADPVKAGKSKPSPDVFLLAASGVNVPCKYCVGIEDAIAGVKALNAASVLSIGIGNNLNADINISDTSKLTYKFFMEVVNGF